MKRVKRGLWLAGALLLSSHSRTGLSAANLRGSSPKIPVRLIAAGPAHAGAPVFPSLPKAAVPGLVQGPELRPGAPLGAFGVIAPQDPKAGPFGPILEDLAPARQGRISGEQAKELSGRLIDGRESFHDADPGSPVGASAAVEPSAARLGAPGAAPRKSPQALSGASPFAAEPGLRQELKDRRRFTGLYWTYYRWYVFDRIVEKWSKYHAQWRLAKARGAPLPVSKPRTFFAEMRGMGESGIFYALGFSALKDAGVVKEARESFRKFFNAPGVGPAERRAFNAFVRRARNYNREKRAQANFRRLVRDAMLEASLKPVKEVADHFNSQFSEDLTKETTAFQAGGAQKILDLFRESVIAAMDQEKKSAPDRVIGVVLLGSFARGAAHPRSDFDVEPVTANGGGSTMRRFIKRLQKKWRALGLDKTNPITVHEIPEPPSKGVLKRVHSESYLVISRDEALVRALERKPGEGPYFAVETEKTWKGRLGSVLQFVLVFCSSVYADLRDFPFL